MQTLQQCPHASRMILSRVYSQLISKVDWANSGIVTGQCHICTLCSETMQTFSFELFRCGSSNIYVCEYSCSTVAACV